MESVSLLIFPFFLMIILSVLKPYFPVDVYIKTVVVAWRDHHYL